MSEILIHVPNCQARIDVARRRLSFIYHSNLTNIEEVEILFAKISEHSSAIDGGFDLISVFKSSMRSVTEGELSQCRAAYSAMVASGLRQIIRVMEPGCPYEIERLDALAEEAEIPVRYARDLDEAHGLLDAQPIAGKAQESAAA